MNDTVIEILLIIGFYLFIIILIILELCAIFWDDIKEKWQERKERKIHKREGHE